MYTELASRLSNQYSTPRKAVVLHGRNDNALEYLTLHDIDPQGQLMMGDYINTDALQRVIAMVNHDSSSNNKNSATLLPEHLLMHDHRQSIWWTPAQTRHLYMRIRGKEVVLVRDCPALVFVRQPNSLAIFALTHNTRPSLHTPLAHAPLFNIGSKGALCLGNAVLPNDLLNTQGAMDAYFQAWSTHTNHANVLRFGSLSSGDSSDKLLKFWQRLGRKPFPVKRLILTNLTLSQVI